jgi:hypothetical protein
VEFVYCVVSVFLLRCDLVASGVMMYVVTLLRLTDFFTLSNVTIHIHNVHSKIKCKVVPVLN